MFLTPEELEQLTGYVRASEQIRWLRAHGILHWINGRGQPVVARDALVHGRALPQPAALGVVP